jgi:FkbH-like protein
MDSHKVIAQILKKHKLLLARSMLNAVAVTEKWSLQLEKNQEYLEDFIELEFFAFVDYLTLYFSAGNEVYLDLFIGEKLKQLYDPKLDFNNNKENKINVSKKDKEVFFEFSLNIPSPDEQKLFLETIEYIYKIVLGDVKKNLRILFVGDCLYLDVIAFLTAPLHRADTAIFPSFATSKNIIELHKTIKSQANENFDLIFYSPYSYEFNIEYNQVFNYRKVNAFNSEFKGFIQSAWQNTKLTMDLLANLFECPIYIHNSSPVHLEESFTKRTIKRFLTALKRYYAKKFVNDNIYNYIVDKNKQTYKHIFLFDETKLVKEIGENILGRFIYSTKLQHPAQLGKAIAREYFDIIFVYAHLINKKVVVCDLDNTLWNGIIGEGKITHFIDRQEILLELKKKGVVLAICSKNDPKNIQWKEAKLTDRDFVASVINWEPKIYGMKEIQEGLNLKFKDFVFLDDSPEEIEMVSLAFPEISCLNATNNKNWDLLKKWSEIIDEPIEMDRTRVYQEREQRKQFLKKDESTVNGIDKKLFNNLNLELTIRQATNEDLKRVTELINRTNQFNVLGSRISNKELQSIHLSDKHKVFVGDVKDRFGGMGTVCILIIQQEKNFLDILTFVLSCRVFGYGIEKAMLNQLKSFALNRNLPIRGRYLPTERNQPCEHVFRDNFFEFSEDYWYWKGNYIEENDSWLKINAMYESGI